MGEITSVIAARIAVRRAVDSRGLQIMLMRPTDMLKPNKVLLALLNAVRPVADGRQFIRMTDDDVEMDTLGEETAVRHISLLANLYAEMLAERREIATA